MKNKYKIIFLILIISLLFTLGACGPSSTTQTMAPIEDSPRQEETEEVEETKETVDSQGIMSVYFLDVGQGDSIYIKAPNGENILIDGGQKKYGDQVVSDLKDLGVEQIDIMIATHPHADHIGGLITVLGELDVKAIYAPRVTHTTRTYEEFVLGVQAQGLKFKEAKAGVDLGVEGIKARFVGPVGTYGDDLNNWSAVLKVEHGETSFLLTGDAELKSEGDMISSGQNLKATVLKLGHHGSSTSTSLGFLDQVQPEYGVILVGAGNKYGHPGDEILAQMKERGIAVYRTDLQGTIIARSDGKEVVFEEEALR